LHVTSNGEASESRLAIRHIKTEIIPNGIDIPALPTNRKWCPDGVVRLLYLGRLDPIKGIENLLEALALLGTNSFNLRICGEGDAAYTEHLRRIANELRVANNVYFVGPISGREKDEAFANSDVCVVPSHRENFGLVVAEAMAYGLPVIAGHGTPWEELDSRGAGLWVKNDPRSLANALHKLRGLNLAAMGRKGRSWMSSGYDWRSISKRFRSLYESLLR
jgi:glycosyltransferase involved in cell wall biosynthesis